MITMRVEHAALKEGDYNLQGVLYFKHTGVPTALSCQCVLFFNFIVMFIEQIPIENKDSQQISNIKPEWNEF